MSEVSRNTSIGGIDLVTVIIALLFLFLWPGVLRYEYRGADGHTRIDRWSHELQVYNVESGKWVLPRPVETKNE